MEGIKPSHAENAEKNGGSRIDNIDLGIK